ncbi:hypothetical protein GCM10010261_63890 [Streptomyces pilosus]|nr:hypothetical protein GCM10010261_63890 [Streptomyces pilosus]
MSTLPPPLRPLKEKNVRTSIKPALVPFITQRKGEEAAPDNLIIYRKPSGARLYYADEDPRDGPMRGILWARCGFNPVDDRFMPTGEPQWKLMHPYRQMVTMARLHCQVCAEPARTGLGFNFLAGPKDYDPTSPTILTNQPPVCAKHARAAAALCPHLEKNPMVFLAQSAPLYGVDKVVYGSDAFCGTRGRTPLCPSGTRACPWSWRRSSSAGLAPSAPSTQTSFCKSCRWPHRPLAGGPDVPRPGRRPGTSPRRGDELPDSCSPTESPPRAGPLFLCRTAPRWCGREHDSRTGSPREAPQAGTGGPANTRAPHRTPEET